MIKKFTTKREFLLERIPMLFGSLANLYSNSRVPPSPDVLYNKAVQLAERIWKEKLRFDSFPEFEEGLKSYYLKKTKVREIGRYYASELYSYFTNRIKPQDFFKPKPLSEEEMMRMYFGETIHSGIQKIFGMEEEKKYEIKIPYNDNETLTLVCKIDLELPNGDIIEFKTRNDLEDFTDSIPPWYNYQVQAYMKAKGLKTMRLYLIGWGFTRRKFDVKYNEVYWEEIVKNLKIFHKSLLSYLHTSKSK